VQVDPIKPTLKAPVSKSFKLKYYPLLSNLAFKFNMRRFIKDTLDELPGGERTHIGRVVQVDPIKPTLVAPGTPRLKLKCDKLLSNFAFKFKLLRYTSGS